MTQFTLKEPDHYRNRNILLVEDIIDEGFTLFDVVRELLRYGLRP
jgi:hypoxanthine-guanine phosphoribosyltransferase